MFHPDMAQCSTILLTESTPDTTQDDINDWLEQDLWNFRRWHIILMFCSGFLAVVICICCCCRFRIPRTKQEIEADYVRKKLTKKFRKQLRMIQNAEMDEMDLKKALDRIREEFKSDAESNGHSDVSSAGSDSPLETYRKASEIGVDIEKLIEQNENRHLTSRFSKWMGSFKVKSRNRKPVSANV